MTAPTYPDIAAFLTAQLDREQAIAEEAAYDGEWRSERSSGDKHAHSIWAGAQVDEQLVACEVMDSDAKFMLANQPKKVLADIAAKRAIVAAIWWVKGCNSMDDLPASDAKTETGWRVVCLLAASYADQPGYRPEWAAEA